MASLNKNVFKMRPVQKWVHDNLRRFNVVIMSRSTGKTVLAINELLAKAVMCEDTSGVPFIYVCPEKAQAKRNAWEPLKYYAAGIDAKIREDELTIQFAHNNAIIRLEGVSDARTLRGMHCGMLVVDEIGDMSREDWQEVLFPTVHAKNAPVIIIGTIKGENLLTELLDTATNAEKNGDPLWKAISVDVVQSGVYTKEYIDTVIRPAIAPSVFDREYMNKRDGKITGTFYGDYLDPTICLGKFPWNPALPVIVGMDLGTVDHTAIWFAQQYGNEIHLIDFYISNGHDKKTNYYINFLKSKPYLYDKIILPHDSVTTNRIDSRTVDKEFRSAGFKVKVLPRTTKLSNDILMVSNQIYKCRFNKETTFDGFIKLSQYRSNVDKLTGLPTGEPMKDSSGTRDCADAFRYLIIGAKDLDMNTMASRGMFGDEYRRYKKPKNYNIRKA